MDIIKYFDKPKIIQIIGDVNTGKSMLIYNLIEELSKYGDYNLYYYKLKNLSKGTEINSVEELEQIKDSIILLDELMSLWDLSNRTKKRTIENTLRLINHNNNILVLCMLPENCKKFIASKGNVFFFKKCMIRDFINGSNTKNIITSYCGVEKGNSVLNLPIDEVLIYDSVHYVKQKIPYLEKYDTKKDNQLLLKPHNKKCNEKCIEKGIEKGSDELNSDRSYFS